MRIAIRLWFGLAFSLYILSVSGQEADTIRRIDLDEVSITSSKVERIRGLLTQTIDITYADQFDQLVSGNRNISEAIAHLPGMAVTALSRNDANWGTYGGIGPKYSTYMLNGLPIDAFVDPMSLDLMGVQRIEIQRGPASVLYSNYLSQDFAGNQSPLAGTVNLVMKERIEDPMVQYAIDYGYYYTLRNRLYFQNHAGRLHCFGGASYEKSDYTDYGTEGSWLNMVDDPEYNKAKFFGGASVYLGQKENHRISMFINHTLHNGDAGRPNRKYDHNYDLIQLAYHGELSPAASLQFKAGYRSYGRTWQEDNFSSGGDLQLVSDNGARQAIIPLDLSFFYKHGKSHLLKAGIDYQQAAYYTWSDPIAGDKIPGNDALSMQGGVYVQEELVFGKISIRAGGRFNYTAADISLLGGQAPGNENQSWTSFLYSGGVRYRPLEGLSVFANAGNSFMAPGLKSIGGTIPLSSLGVAGQNGQLPNPDLKPESGLGIDLGIEWQKASLIRISARGFLTSVSNAIIDNVVSQDPSQTQSINAGQTRAPGAEVAILCTPLKWLECFANYTWMNSRVFNDKDPDQDGAYVPFAPSSVANIGISTRLPYHFRLSTSLHYSDYYYDSSSKSGRSPVPGHELLNASISKIFFISAEKNQGVELYMNFYNLTDNRFKMPWQFQDPGFSLSGGIKVTI